MKFLRFVSAGYPQGCCGMIEDENQVRVLAADPLVKIEKTSELMPLDSVTRYLPPVEPPNIIAIGLNYRAHAEEGKAEVPDTPLMFLKTTTTLSAHKEPVILPREAPDQVDYEVELAVVIKDKTRHVSEETALEHVFGYAVGQDISARDCQFKDGQWARGKSFDTFCPIGPWIETELDPANVMLSTRLNGKIMQEQTTADMVFSVAYLISYLSRMMTLLPGTLIMSGTPSGVGFTRQPPVYLHDGDIITSTIEGIGEMENRVVLESAE